MSTTSPARLVGARELRRLAQAFEGAPGRAHGGVPGTLLAESEGLFIAVDAAHFLGTS